MYIQIKCKKELYVPRLGCHLDKVYEVRRAKMPMTNIATAQFTRKVVLENFTDISTVHISHYSKLTKNNFSGDRRIEK